MATILDQNFTTAPNDNYNVGWDSGTDQVWQAQQFTPSVSASLNQWIFQLKKNLSPTGNLTIEIYTDNGSDSPNTQTGTTSGTIAESSLTTSFVEYTFTWSTPVPLTSGTKYWAVIKTSRVIDADNYTMIGNNTGAGYTGGVAKYWTGAAWSSVLGDFYFKEYYDDTTIATTTTSTSTSSSTTSTSSST